jgi:hypothetical protein
MWGGRDSFHMGDITDSELLLPSKPCLNVVRIGFPHRQSTIRLRGFDQQIIEGLDLGLIL